MKFVKCKKLQKLTMLYDIMNVVNKIYLLKRMNKASFGIYEFTARIKIDVIKIFEDTLYLTLICSNVDN